MKSILGTIFVVVVYGGIYLWKRMQGIKYPFWGLCSAMCLLVGCQTSHGPSFDYPSAFAAMCEQTRQQAKVCIESKGLKCTKENSEIVKALTATICINTPYGPMWCAKDSNGNPYGGYTVPGNPVQIVICVNPVNGIPNSVYLLHEQGHYWQVSNNLGQGHPPAIAGCFVYWRDALKASCEVENGLPMGAMVDYLGEIK